jgi:hypothetical protein
VKTRTQRFSPQMDRRSGDGDFCRGSGVVCFWEVPLSRSLTQRRRECERRKGRTGIFTHRWTQINTDAEDGSGRLEGVSQGAFALEGKRTRDHRWTQIRGDAGFCRSSGIICFWEVPLQTATMRTTNSCAGHGAPWGRQTDRTNRTNRMGAGWRPHGELVFSLIDLIMGFAYSPAPVSLNIWLYGNFDL